MAKVGRDRIKIEDDRGETLDDLRVQKAKRRDDKPAAIFAYKQWKSQQTGEILSIVVHDGGPPKVNGKTLKERNGAFVPPAEVRGQPVITADCSDHAKRKTVSIPAAAHWQHIRTLLLDDFRAYRRLVEKKQKEANSKSSTFIRNRVHTIKTILNYYSDT